MSGNEPFGHSTGDYVLRQVSRRLWHSVGYGDMVRFGGEEFLVILNKCNPASVGLALSSDFTPSDVEELLHQADMPLYARSEARRNCVRIAHPNAADKMLV